MLLYEYSISNGESVPHGTHGVDVSRYYRTHICSEIRNVNDIVRHRIDIPV